jgi:hypothetical protein
MKKCKWKKTFFSRKCGKDVAVEGANYCLEHGCSFFCVFKNPLTLKTSFGKDVCDKCFKNAELEYKKRIEIDFEFVRTERGEYLKKWHYETAIDIDNSFPDFYQELKEVFYEMVLLKESLIRKVRRWKEELKDFLLSSRRKIDRDFSFLTIEEREGWKKIYEKVIEKIAPSYDEFCELLWEERNFLVCVSQQRKLKKELENLEQERGDYAKKVIELAGWDLLSVSEQNNYLEQIKSSSLDSLDSIFSDVQISVSLQREREREQNWKIYLIEIYWPRIKNKGL